MRCCAMTRRITTITSTISSLVVTTGITIQWALWTTWTTSSLPTLDSSLQKSTPPWSRRRARSFGAARLLAGTWGSPMKPTLMPLSTPSPTLLALRVSLVASPSWLVPSANSSAPTRDVHCSSWPTATLCPSCGPWELRRGTRGRPTRRARPSLEINGFWIRLRAVMPSTPPSRQEQSWSSNTFGPKSRLHVHQMELSHACEHGGRRSPQHKSAWHH
mmetsp:Transcript_21916/g.58035  ORF Transcript_21916/g.58035 Transcript_21916/m.58035 type:complete len:217 (+) Transcript_21916:666-1316(+)